MSDYQDSILEILVSEEPVFLRRLEYPVLEAVRVVRMSILESGEELSDLELVKMAYWLVWRAEHQWCTSVDGWEDYDELVRQLALETARHAFYFLRERKSSVQHAIAYNRGCVRRP